MRHQTFATLLCRNSCTPTSNAGTPQFDTVAAGHIQQAGLHQRQGQRANLAEREHTAGDATAYVLGRRACGFRAYELRE